MVEVIATVFTITHSYVFSFSRILDVIVRRSMGEYRDAISGVTLVMSE